MQLKVKMLPPRISTSLVVTCGRSFVSPVFVCFTGVCLLLCCCVVVVQHFNILLSTFNLFSTLENNVVVANYPAGFGMSTTQVAFLTRGFSV